MRDRAEGSASQGRYQASPLINFLIELPRQAKRFIILTGDAVAVPFALWCALVVKYDQFGPFSAFRPGLFVVATGIALVIFSAFGLYRAVIRFIGPKAMVLVGAAVTLSVFALGAYDRMDGDPRLSLSVLAVYWAFALLYVLGSRFVARYILSRPLRGTQRRARIAIYGAGDAGVRLFNVLRGGPHFDPVVFIDDKRALQGNTINGAKVLAPEVLPDLVKRYSIERVLLAMPSASRRRRQEILSSLEPLGIRLQSLPNLHDIITGVARIDDIRDVDVSDLLGRDPVPPNPSLFEYCVRNKVVMVTGAGGSIGSELCRQILRLGPRRLVLFEMSELALYCIARNLEEIARTERISVEILPLLGNAHHRHRVREVISTCDVQTIYHAAAYKHVPIVEHNVIEGIHNNVISTWYTAEAALETGVETFVLISTDKAVNPANVMGATKRLAELVLQALQQRTSVTRFSMVRFGNVLDSSGSVVPLFREQIRCGGPVTVTHPDVIRYFMTIPEAAQLVIQAGAMGKGGDVFVLDMGRPVRIDDLARRMINLMGLTVRDSSNPEGDIEITYTGLRTAEKLFEELLIGTNVTGTDHPRILRAMEYSLPWERMQQILNELLVALASFDCRRAIAILAEAVVEFDRKESIDDYVWVRKASTAEPEMGKVTAISGKRRVSDAPKAG